MSHSEKLIRAYLSYKKSEVDTGEIKALKAACASEGIELKYDENSTYSGESFVDFMNDEIVGARFLIIFLTPQYFKTAYTLYEFIRVTQADSYNPSISLACVRKSEAMGLKLITEVEDFIQEDGSVDAKKEVNEIARLLKLDEKNTEFGQMRREIFSDIKLGWNNLLVKDLQRILKTFAEGKPDAQYYEKFYSDIAKGITSQYEENLKDSQNLAVSTVRTEITGLLDVSSVLRNAVEKEFNAASSLSVEKLADKLLQCEKISKAVMVIARSIRAVRDSGLYSDNSNLWKETANVAKQLCGWLVLLSVEPVWLAHNVHKLKGSTRLNLLLAKKQLPFAEVIISSSVLEAARFQRDKKGRLTPNFDNPERPVFDSGKKGIFKQVLTPMYIELMKGDVGPDDTDEFVEDITDSIDSEYESSGKPKFYLITNNTFKLISAEKWFKEFSQKVKGKLLFLVIDNEDKSCNAGYCVEKISVLLSAVAQVYRDGR